jgi:iron complex outermembrane recepter protein
MRKATVMWLLAGASVLMPVQAQAQPQDTREEKSGGGGEIVVTAQRREESLTKVPLSIVAETGEALAAKGIEGLTGVRFSTPGFIAQTGTGYTQIYIRGIGNGVYVGADPSVATFVDDVPFVYGSLVDDLVNVERVEILKGAQGGLYGRNASGGVVNIITRQPSDELSGIVRTKIGSRETVLASAYVNVPLSENAAWNVSATRNWHGGYRKNVAFDQPYSGADAANGFNTNARPGKLNNLDVWSFDTKLRVNLTDNFKVTLGADYTDDRDASGNGWLTRTPERTRGTYLFLAGVFGIQNPVGPWPTLSEKGNESYGAIPNKSWTESYGGSVKGELALDGVDLTSITAFRWNNSQFQGDLGAAPVPIAGFSTDFRRKYGYQELRAVSNGDGPFQWLGGASYFEDRISGSIASVTLGLFGAPTLSQTQTRNWSVYGQASYELVDNLTLAGSLRYVNEKKSVAFPAPNPITNTMKVDKFLPSATLSYDLGDGTIYVRYAKGFKTGGPNPLVRPDRLPGETTGLLLDPENVDTYEAGYRATLFDRKVQFTSAIFYNKYKGIHVVTAGNGPLNADISNALINLGDARTYGAEAAVSWRVSDPLTVSANLGYLNAKYQNAVFEGSALLLPLDASGKRMILAPEWQGGVQASFDQPFSDSLRLQANVLFSYISAHYFTSQQIETMRQKGYSVVNAKLGLATMDDRITVFAYANNVFDTRYAVFGTSNSVTDNVTPGDPPIIGGGIEVRF